MLHLKNTLILLFLALFSFSSCEKEDEGPLITRNVVQHGKWKVTLFNDNGTDKTSNYAGYELTFNANGTLTAEKPGATASGSWSPGEDVTKNNLILNFGTTPLFNELSSTWQAIEQTSKKLRLQQVSGGTDLLTLERI